MNATTKTWTLGIALAAAAACAEAGGAPPRPTNLVIVALDTLRPDHLGCYGYPLETSPNLDRLAAESLVFERAQSAAPWTAPSLISLMTSLHPDVHGIQADPGRMSESIPTLAEILSEHGFATAAFTEGGYAKGDFGLDQGFDVYPRNPGDDDNHASNRHYPSRIESNVDRALEWLADQAEAPFFLFFQTYEPHTPMRAPESFVREFLPGYDESAEHEALVRAVERWNATREVGREELEVLRRHLFHCEFAAAPPIEDREQLRDVSDELGVSLRRGAAADDPALVEWVSAIYDAEILFADRVLQRLWDALSAAGRMDDTLLVIVSDHGEGLGDHGRMGHGKVLHEELMRVVCILRLPGAGLAGRVEELVGLIDVAPTALELLGVDPSPYPFQGRSLAGELAAPAPDRAFFGHSLSNRAADHYTVTTERWRLIMDGEADRRWLYDLDADTGELHDVAGLHPDVASRLETLIDSQREADRDLADRLGARVQPLDLADDTREDLQGLGYLGGDE